MAWAIGDLAEPGELSFEPGLERAGERGCFILAHATAFRGIAAANALLYGIERGDAAERFVGDRARACYGDVEEICAVSAPSRKPA